MSDKDRILLREVLEKLDKVLERQDRILAQLRPTYTATLVPPQADDLLGDMMQAPTIIRFPVVIPDPNFPATTDGK